MVPKVCLSALVGLLLLPGLLRAQSQPPSAATIVKCYHYFQWQLPALRKLKTQRRLDAEMVNSYCALQELDQLLERQLKGQSFPRQGAQLFTSWVYLPTAGCQEIQALQALSQQWCQVYQQLSTGLSKTQLQQVYTLYQTLCQRTRLPAQQAFDIAAVFLPLQVPQPGRYPALLKQRLKLEQDLRSQVRALVPLRSQVQTLLEKKRSALLADYFQRNLAGLAPQAIKVLIKHKQQGRSFTQRQAEFLLAGKDINRLHHQRGMVSVGKGTVLQKLEPTINFKYGTESFLGICMVAAKWVTPAERVEENADMLIWGYVRWHDFWLTIKAGCLGGKQPAYRFWSDLKPGEQDADFERGGKVAQEELKRLLATIDRLVKVLAQRANQFQTTGLAYTASAFQQHMQIKEHLLRRSELPPEWHFTLGKKEPETGSRLQRHPYGLKLAKPYISREDLFQFFHIPVHRGEFLKNAVQRILRSGKSPIDRACPFWGLIYAADCHKELDDQGHSVVTKRIYTPWGVTSPLTIELSWQPHPTTIAPGHYLLEPIRVPHAARWAQLKPKIPPAHRVQQGLLFSAVEPFVHHDFEHYYQTMLQVLQQNTSKPQTLEFYACLAYNLYRH